MKKITLVAVVLLVCASMTSCKKDWTCTCSDPTGDSETIAIKDKKKKDAQSACNTLDVLWATGGGSCVLK